MSLLIKGAQIIDGEGSQPFKADVLVQKNLISAVGDLKNKRADTVIESFGNYLTPGFIDIDTDSDHYGSLFTNPAQSAFREQGVTTIVGGHCGASLAPLLYGTLESLHAWVDTKQVNVNWQTVTEFLTQLKRLPLGVNFGTLVGYTTVRQAITHGQERALTDKELEVVKGVVTRAVREGAFGLSTGLEYLHGRIVSERELSEVVRIISNLGAVYSTHLRNQKERLVESIRQTIALASATSVKTLVSHLRPLIGFEEQFERARELIRDNAASASIYFDIYPHDTSWYTIYALLPRWAKTGNVQQVQEYLRKPNIKQEILSELKQIDFEDVQVASAPDHEYVVGKTITELSEDFGVSPAEALLKLMETTRLRATVLYRNINQTVLTRALNDERAFIASNGNAGAPGKFLHHDRFVNTFPTFINLTVTTGGLTLEKAIQKITSAPAQYFNIPNRGMIKEGKIADMVLLCKEDYSVKETIVGGETKAGKPLKYKYTSITPPRS